MQSCVIEDEVTLTLFNSHSVDLLCVFALELQFNPRVGGRDCGGHQTILGLWWLRSFFFAVYASLRRKTYLLNSRATDLMSRRICTKSSDLFYAHGSTYCVNLIGCNRNVANKIHVRKLHRLSIGCVLSHQPFCWGFATDVSPWTALCHWGPAEVASCHLLLCVQACRDTLSNKLKLFLYARRGRTTGSVECFQVERRCVCVSVCVFLWDHNVLPWPDDERSSVSSSMLPTLLPLEPSSFSSTFVFREVRSPYTQMEPLTAEVPCAGLEP